jgi:hypothetical protein
VPTLDELAPRLVREKRLDLLVWHAPPISYPQPDPLPPDYVPYVPPPDVPPTAFRPTTIQVSYARCKPDGVMLPLIFEVQGPSASSYQRRDFTRCPPVYIVFTPREKGRHLVILREAHHHRWWGSLEIQVSGSPK